MIYIMRAVKCWIGWHEWVQYIPLNAKVQKVECVWCGKEK